MIALVALLHSLFPKLHCWAEMTRGPLRWTCAGCGARRNEMPWTGRNLK
ncbi:hypothetical protein SAMN05442782_2428 [Streptomyces sp. OK228]|nr:hypothetical protein SAMN05442782_2428 [Streptomyces sp. OK228]